MPKFTNTYTFMFAAGVCMVCSLGVAAAARGLRPMQDVNKARDLQINILGALGLPEDGHKPLPEEIDALWSAHVQEIVVNPQGEAVEASTQEWKDAWIKVRVTREPPELLPVFQRLDDGELVRHAIYMEGTGLWGPVSAYIAVDPPGETVLGTTFFGPLETPGLGAEIHEKWFRDQFIGKKVVDESGAAAAVMVAKGKAADVCPDNLEYCVDGIAGSTLTGDGINEMFERCIEYYEPFFTTIRTP